MDKDNIKDGYYWAKHKKSGNTIIIEKDFDGWWCCGSERELGVYEYMILGAVKPHEEKSISNVIKRKIGKWEAIIDYNEAEQLYIITFNGEGGAIVSNKYLPEAERKFIDGMLLAEAVDKLLNFEDHGSFDK